MIGTADLVGVGEATHGSTEFVAVKDHLRHLVRTKGFTTFALEAAWSTGVRLGEWVRGGPEDLGRIMDADMSRWMRKYNRTHDDRELRIVRNDVAYAGPAQVDTITAYVACHSPVLLPEIQRLYRDRDRESRPTAGMGETVDMYQRLPLADRRRMRDNVMPAACDHAAPGQGDGRQHSVWQRNTGEGVFLPTPNQHITAESAVQTNWPRTPGEFLREGVGARYVNGLATRQHAPGVQLRRTDPPARRRHHQNSLTDR
ncbi:erythromycin esterase family protein [Embleya sp. NPDC059259]|uniref:erythromycin esterase family protein n=1 Tax=unclassified Embleya TaxID=2699296 RepID=UPI00369D47C5